VNGGDGGGDDEACDGDEVDAEEHRMHVAALDEMKTAAVAAAQMLNSEVVDQSAMFEMRKNRHCLSSQRAHTRAIFRKKRVNFDTQGRVARGVTMTTPPSSSANEVTVYAVRRLRTAQRDDVRADWLRGQVCGFFNLPTAALFDSCTDYCIREPERPVVDAGPSAAELEELRAAAKRCRQAEHELRQAKDANEKLKAKMGELEMALTQAKSDGEASIRQLKTELDDERGSVRDLIVENRDLHRRIDELE
jgi:hypothetical protein